MFPQASSSARNSNKRSREKNEELGIPLLLIYFFSHLLLLQIEFKF